MGGSILPGRCYGRDVTGAISDADLADLEDVARS